jgi:3-dehydroquinate dehydratase II
MVPAQQTSQNLAGKVTAHMPAFKSILVLHGPNLNLLGEREPQHYGSISLDAINQRLKDRANEAGVMLAAFQCNAEGELVDRIQQAQRDAVDFIVINPAAFTHTSVAVRDVLAAVRIPFIEVHLSNVFRREEFRRHSYLSDLAAGVISGLGAKGYELALDYALQ